MDHLQLLQMLLSRGRIDDNIVQVEGQGFTLLVTKHPLHQSLECARGITQTKGHGIKFEQDKGHTEVDFKLVFLCDRNLVVTTGQINKRKPLSPSECLQTLLNGRKRKTLLASLTIKEAVVNVQTSAPILS